MLHEKEVNFVHVCMYNNNNENDQIRFLLLEDLGRSGCNFIPDVVVRQLNYLLEKRREKNLGFFY